VLEFKPYVIAKTLTQHLIEKKAHRYTKYRTSLTPENRKKSVGGYPNSNKENRKKSVGGLPKYTEVKCSKSEVRPLNTLKLVDDKKLEAYTDNDFNKIYKKPFLSMPKLTSTSVESVILLNHTRTEPK